MNKDNPQILTRPSTPQEKAGDMGTPSSLKMVRCERCGELADFLRNWRCMKCWRGVTR
jgi:hypothetical protein